MADRISIKDLMYLTAGRKGRYGYVVFGLNRADGALYRGKELPPVIVALPATAFGVFHLSAPEEPVVDTDHTYYLDTDLKVLAELSAATAKSPQDYPQTAVYYRLMTLNDRDAETVSLLERAALALANNPSSLSLDLELHIAALTQGLPVHGGKFLPDTEIPE